jgi:F0F1-type ATP synthase membrane subunit b/b'
MSALEIAIGVNVLLMIALLSVIFKPNIINYIGKRQKRREKRLETIVKKIVVEYLETLKND